jgi:hypothetical protein
MGELGFCTARDILHIIQVSLISDITTDGNVSLWLIRLLHNKAVFMLWYSARCYGAYFDITQIMRIIPVILLPYIMVALTSGKKRRWIWLAQLLFPLPLIIISNLGLGLRIELFKWYYLALSAIGAIKLTYWLFNGRKALKYPQNGKNQSGDNSDY